MLIRSISANAPAVPGVWPYTIPAVATLVDDGLELTSDIAVLVGANGSGKSTIIEAVAEAYGLDVRGGHGGRKYGSTLAQTELHSVLRLDRSAAGSRFVGRRAKGFFLRAETMAGVLEFMTGAGVAAYGERPASEVSHGESYLQAIVGRFDGPGLYLLDEAEGPLSFESTLALAYRLQELAEEDDTQILYATHSPLIAAIPGAQILELGDEGLAQRRWDELAMVGLWRTFLDRPDRFLSSPTESHESGR